MQPNDQQPSVDGTGTTPNEPINTETINNAPTSEQTNTNESAAPEAPAATEVVPPTVPSEGAPSVSPVTESPATQSAQNATEPSTPPQNPVVMPAAAGPAIADRPKPRFSKKVKLIALVALIIVLLGGASAGAYYGVIAPSQPQRIIGDSLSNTLNSEKTKSAKFEGELTCLKGDSCKSFSAVLFKGAASENGSFDMNMQFKTVVTTVNLDARYVDKAAYLRLSGLNGLDKLLDSFGGGTGNNAEYARIISQLNDKWYTFDESLLKQMGGNVTVPSGDEKLSKADAQKVGDAYKNHQFIKINKKLTDEPIHSQSSYHLQATIDKAELKAFLNEVKADNIKGMKLEQSDIDKIDQADFSKYPFDIWVNKSNRMISQLATTITQDNESVKLRIALYDYNQPVTVEKPAGAKSVLELISEFAPLYSGGVQGAETQNPFSLLGI